MPEIQDQESGATAHRFAPAAPDGDAVYGACCPGWHSAASHSDALDDWVAFMRRRDVAHVCCLLPGGESDSTGGNVERYRETFESALHAPIPDCKLADRRLFADEVLPFLDDAVAADESVVVHCLDGLGRTGQVLAVWLAHDRDYGPERAIETVESTGRHPREPVESGNATAGELKDLLATFASDPGAES
ncbi:MAG: protein phosphatase [Haloarculaceae archaeon]